MQDYQTADDFFADESFQDFALRKSAKEILHWEKYLKDNPHMRPQVEEAQKMVSLFNPISIGDNLQTIPLVESDKKVSWPGKTIAYIATAMLAVAIIGYAVYQYVSTEAVAVEYEATQTYASESEIRLIDMPDGTRFALKPNSQLTVFGSWDKLRSVELEGDAFFDVSHDPERPMTIRTTEGVIQVLGTSFSVNSIHSYEVVLNDGRILWKHNDYKEQVLSPNDRLQLSEAGPTISQVVASDYSSWTNSKLHFKDVKLSKVVDILKHSYGLDVEVKNPRLLTKSITANIPKNDPVLMLEAIAAIYNIQLKETNGKYLLQ